MSIDAIEHGVQAEREVVTWYSVRCDDSPSGWVKVTKTPPTGANAMTVTIKPMYGEPFTVNADLLQAAMKMALHDRPAAFRDEVSRAVTLRRRVDGLTPGDRVAVLRNGRVNRRRVGTVEAVEAYSIVVQLDRQSDEEKPHFLRYEATKDEVVEVYDRAAA